jgi:hypothetical protein
MLGNNNDKSESKVDVPVYTAREIDLNSIKDLIAKRASFKIVAIENMKSVVNSLEGQIEKQKLSCRTYLEYRSAALGVGLSPIGAGWGQLVAAVAGIGIGVHKLATFNPDYEIAKNPLKSHIFVTFKKSIGQA